MKRHYYISDNLDDLEQVEEELEQQGFSTPQIHVLSLKDADVAEHDHLNEVEAVLRKDVVHGTEIGALIGIAGAATVLAVAYFSGWPDRISWVPFIFLAVVVLGFCTWEGGLFGIQEPHKQFKRFQALLVAGKHIFLVDVKAKQEAILTQVIDQYPALQAAGVGSATPGLVLWWRQRWSRFMKSMP